MSTVIDVGGVRVSALNDGCTHRKSCRFMLVAVSRRQPATYRTGGNHAQRDIIDLTLIAAATRAGQHSLAQALIAERVARKPSAAGVALQLLTENSRTATAGLADQGVRS